MDASALLLALGGAGGLGMIVRQVRLGLRDRGDRKLLRHIYDQDRRAGVLEALQRLRLGDLPVSPRTAGGNSDSQESESGQ